MSAPARVGARRDVVLHFAGAGVAKIAPSLVQLVLLLFVARAASLDDVGLLAIGSAVAFLCGALAELGLATSMSIPDVAFETEGPPLRATRRLRLSAAVLGTLLYALLWAAGLGGHEPQLLLAAPLPLALALAYGYAGAMNATARLRYEIPVSIGESVLILALALIGSLFLPALTASLAALSIGRGAGALARMLLVRDMPQSPVPHVPGAVRAQLPFALATVGWVIQGQIDMVAIGFTGGLALAAVYGPLVRTAYSTLLSAEALSWALFGGANPDEAAGSSRLGSRWRPLMIAFGLVFGLVFVLLAKPFLELLLDRDPGEIGVAVALLGLVIVTRFGSLTVHVDLVRSGAQRAEVPVLFASAVLLGVGSGIGAAAGSLTAIAAARLASEVLIAGGFLAIRSRGSAAPERNDEGERPEAGGQLRVLILAPFTPRLDAGHGGSRVIAQSVTRLGHRARVAVLCLREPSEPPVDGAVRDAAVLVDEVIKTPTSSAAARIGRFVGWRAGLLLGRPFWVSDLRRSAYRVRFEEVVRRFEPDVVQVEYTAMAQYLTALDQSRAARVLVEHDPEAGTPERGRVARRLDAAAWRGFRRRALRDVDAVVVFTERDRAALELVAGSTRVVRIPIGAEIPERAVSPPAHDGGVLFVGNFQHAPNVDAALRLVKSIFPLVRRRHPGAVLYLVGASPPAELTSDPSSGVIVTGHVDEVGQYVERAAVVAAPLRRGGGMRVKVLEALAGGSAVVASPLAADGLDVVDGRELAIATTDEEFADRIGELLEDVGARNALAERARAWARQNLTWNASIEAYLRLYAEILAESGGPFTPGRRQ